MDTNACIFREGSRGGSLGADEPPFEAKVPFLCQVFLRAELILDCKLTRRWASWLTSPDASRGWVSRKRVRESLTGNSLHNSVRHVEVSRRAGVYSSMKRSVSQASEQKKARGKHY